jgi:hypothetical protein
LDDEGAYLELVNFEMEDKLFYWPPLETEEK